MRNNFQQISRTLNCVIFCLITGLISAQNAFSQGPSASIQTLISSQHSVLFLSQNVLNAPDAMADSNSPVCEGDTIFFTGDGAGPGGTYTWSGPNGFSSNEQNPIIPNAQASHAGVYQLIVEDSLGEKDTATALLIIRLDHVLLLDSDPSTEDQMICDGADVDTIAYQLIGGATSASVSGLPAGMNFSLQADIFKIFGAPVSGLTGVGTVSFDINVYSDGNVCTPDTANITISIFKTIAEASYSGSVCETGEIQLFSDGSASGGSYSWSGPGGYSSTEQNPLISNIASNQSGTYVVTVTDDAGCSDTAQTDVLIYPNPAIDAGSDTSFCLGGSSLLTAVADGGAVPYTYTWDQGLGDGQSHMVMPDVSTIYTVVVTDSLGCVNSDLVEITVYENPVASAGMDQGVCFGSSTDISANATGGNDPYTYFWDNGLGDGQTHNVLPIDSTIYSVTVTDSLGCTSTDDMLVFIHSLPAVLAIEDMEICIGSSAVITAAANGGMEPYMYSWDEGLGDGQSHNVSPDTATIYTVTVTDLNGCTATDQVSIGVNLLPVPVISGDNTICDGDSTFFDAGAGFEQYTWSNGAATQQIHIGSANTYAVSVTDLNGCVGSDSLELIVYANPVADAGTDTSICFGDSTSLNGNASGDYPPFSFSWDNGLGDGQNFEISPDSTTNYTLTVIDTNACSAMDQVLITVHENPVANAGPDVAICFGDSISILASASGGLAPYTFTWDNGLGEGESFDVSPDTNTIYSVLVIDSNSCQSIDAMEVVVNENPVADAGTDATICFGDSTSLMASASGGLAPYTFTWDNGLGEGESFDVSPDSTTTYTVTVVDSLNCSDTDELTVHVNNNPVPDISGDSSICDGDSSLLDAGAGYNIYLWNTGDTTQQITVSIEDSYVVMVTDSNGCTGLDSFSLFILENPTADAGLDVAFCHGDSTTITASASGGLAPYSYSWDNGLGDGQSFTVSPDSSTVYTVSVLDSLGCSDTDEMLITVYANPVPVISGETSICQGDTVIYDAGSGYVSYAWNTGDTTKLITTDTSGIYTVMVVDTNGCMGSATVVLEVHENPDAIANLDTSICFGDSTTVAAYATGGNPPYTFTWDNGLGEGQEFTVSPDSTTSYIVTAVDSFGCSALDTVVVTVHENPIANAGTDAAICYGDSTTILASANGGQAPYTFTWDNSLGEGESFLVSPEVSTVYSVTAVDSLGCTDTDAVQVIVHENPVIDIEGLDAVCTGDTTDLDAGANYVSYAWSTGDTTQFIQVFEEGGYIVIVIDSNACVGTDSFEFSLYDNPVADAGLDASICINDSTNISASASGGAAPYTYTWDNGLGDGQSFDVSPATNTNYTVLVTDSLGCQGADNVEITVNPLPTPQITGDLIICENQSGILNAGEGYVSYQWSSGENTQQINVDQQGIYSVMVVDTNGCKATAFNAVNIVLANQDIISGDLDLCGQDSTILDAGAGYNTYLWSNGDTTQTLQVYAGGLYSLTVTNNLDCPIYDDITVNQHPGITANAGTDVAICRGETTTLAASPEGGEGPYNYAWDQGIGEGQSQTVSPDENTVYTVTITDVNGCDATDAVMVTVNDLPVVNAGDDQVICEGDSVSVMAEIEIGTGMIDYFWNNGLGDGQGHDFVPDSTDLYTVMVTDENGCTGTDQLQILVNQNPEPVIAGNAVLCNGLENELDAGDGYVSYIWNTGDTTQIISTTGEGTYSVEVTDINGCMAATEVEVITGAILTVEITGDLEFCMGETSVLDAGTGFDQYAWSTGETTQTIEVLTSDSYAVTVSSANSCDAEDMAEVIVHENPLVFAGEDVEICEGDSLELFAEAIGGLEPYSYIWDQGLGEGQVHTVQPSVSTSYIVVAADDNNCFGEDDITVSVSPSMEVVLSPDSSLVITGGVMPYDTVYTQEGDSLMVLITDAFGCTAEDKVFVTGVSEIEIQLISRVFPNPADQVLYLEIADHNYGSVDLRLVDITGKTVYTNTVIPDVIRMDDINAGTYQLQIITEAGMQVIPVVIIH